MSDRRPRTFYATERIVGGEVTIHEFSRKQARDQWVYNRHIRDGDNVVGQREVAEASHPAVRRWKRDEARYRQRVYEVAYGRKAAAEIVRFLAGEPGIYFHIPMELYLAFPAVSNSYLTMASRKSLRHAQHQMESDDESTDSMKLGTIIHMAVLEPDQYEEIPRSGGCAATKKDGDQCTNPGKELGTDGFWYCGVHSKGRETSEPELVRDEATEAMVNGILASMKEVDPRTGEQNAAWELLRGSQTLSEVTLLFHHRETGMLCKARPDRWARHLSTVPDIKSTDDVGEFAFSRTVYKRKYYRKMALIRYGFEALGEPQDDFVLVAVERKPVYAVKAWRLFDEDLDMGMIEIHEELDRLKKAQEEDYFPTYGMGVSALPLPPYATRQVAALFTDEMEI